MPSDNSESSLVSEISKEELLELLEESQTNSPSLDIEKLEGDDDVGAWIRLIREFLIQCGDDVLLSELIGQHLLPRGKAWLAF